MFKYDFDETAQRAIDTAIREARQRNHKAYSIEHILLGLSATDSPVSGILQDHGLSYENITQQMRHWHPHRHDMPTSLTPAAPYVGEIFEHAQAHLKEFGYNDINCTYLLYSTASILDRYECVAAKICRDLQVNRDVLLHDVSVIMEEEAQARRAAEHTNRQRDLQMLVSFNIVDAESFVMAVIETVDEDQLIQILDRIKVNK